jgi:hypothetical protein
LEATVDLPTPPLPEPMPMMWRTPEGFIDPCCGFMCPPICRLGGVAGRLRAGCRRGLRGGAMGGQRDHHLLHARQFLQKLLAGQPHGLHPFGHLGAFGLEDEGHPPALHVQRPHQVAGDHVAAIGQGQLRQGLQDGLAGLAHVLSFLRAHVRSPPEIG